MFSMYYILIACLLLYSIIGLVVGRRNELNARNGSFFSLAKSRKGRTSSKSRLVLITRMDGPPEYEVGQYFLRGHLKPYPFYFPCAESVTRARVHDKKGKKITWVRIIFIEHFTRTKLIYAEILRQGSSSVVVSLITHLPRSRRSGKGMIGMIARTWLPSTNWSPDRFVRVQLGTYRFVSRRFRTHSRVFLGTHGHWW